MKKIYFFFKKDFLNSVAIIIALIAITLFFLRDCLGHTPTCPQIVCPEIKIEKLTCPKITCPEISCPEIKLPETQGFPTLKCPEVVCPSLTFGKQKIKEARKSSKKINYSFSISKNVIYYKKEDGQSVVTYPCLKIQIKKDSDCLFLIVDSKAQKGVIDLDKELKFSDYNIYKSKTKPQFCSPYTLKPNKCYEII